MECKVTYLLTIRTRLLVLIETLWNVKTGAKGFKVSSDGVLIETLWNVKTVHLIQHKLLMWVLIETLWNVKTFYKYFSCSCF